MVSLLNFFIVQEMGAFAVLLLWFKGYPHWMWQIGLEHDGVGM
jgi:hypothetical protein